MRLNLSKLLIYLIVLVFARSGFCHDYLAQYQTETKYIAQILDYKPDFEDESSTPLSHEVLRKKNIMKKLSLNLRSRWESEKDLEELEEIDLESNQCIMLKNSLVSVSDAFFDSAKERIKTNPNRINLGHRLRCFAAGGSFFKLSSMGECSPVFSDNAMSAAVNSAKLSMFKGIVETIKIILLEGIDEVYLPQSQDDKLAKLFEYDNPCRPKNTKKLMRVLLRLEDRMNKIYHAIHGEDDFITAKVNYNNIKLLSEAASLTTPETVKVIKKKETRQVGEEEYVIIRRLLVKSKKLTHYRKAQARKMMQEMIFWATAGELLLVKAGVGILKSHSIIKRLLKKNNFKKLRAKHIKRNPLELQKAKKKSLKKRKKIKRNALRKQKLVYKLGSMAKNLALGLVSLTRSIVVMAVTIDLLVTQKNGFIYAMNRDETTKKIDLDDFINNDDEFGQDLENHFLESLRFNIEDKRTVMEARENRNKKASQMTCDEKYRLHEKALSILENCPGCYYKYEKDEVYHCEELDESEEVQDAA